MDRKRFTFQSQANGVLVLGTYSQSASASLTFADSIKNVFINKIVFDCLIIDAVTGACMSHANYHVRGILNVEAALMLTASAINPPTTQYLLIEGQQNSFESLNLDVTNGVSDPGLVFDINITASTVNNQTIVVKYYVEGEYEIQNSLML